MTGKMKFAAALLMLVAFADVPSAFARGGGANLMSSPGYQRRLQESRQEYSRAYTTPPAVYPGRKWRHRRHHYY
ncbi:MAG: hypothetical protein HY242_10410 [Afipia sp.]|nr:hypothetical protein [Afipia sp.]